MYIECLDGVISVNSHQQTPGNFLIAALLKELEGFNDGKLYASSATKVGCSMKLTTSDGSGTHHVEFSCRVNVP
ncbi:ribosome-binding factor A domain protein [Teladorsagia circumcincta]|uniref:Ribosome-binding factor A domain protein n=1 Tax=Teladorsagia circumcincta TaxID=45464 RepID=A0A2G9UUR0_TELCI|nr:ribosome-binding factor A domain protein [Teladorsagia circumcincta]